jgi:tRNA G37 N-methylase TrmD
MSERLDIDVLTIFPEVVRAPLSESILGRASDEGTIVKTSMSKRSLIIIFLSI